MTLTVDMFAWRFTGLPSQLLLLLLDPAKLRDGKDPDRFELHPPRRRNSYTTGRRVDAEVDILDVLRHHFYGDFAKFDRRHHQYSICCLMMRKTRSTSSTFCKTPYSAALITCSRA